MIKINYDFIEKHIVLQGIKVLYTNVNNGIFQVYTESTYDFAVCSCWGHITRDVHDSRCQSIKHLTIWGMGTEVILKKKRYVCDCDPKHPFDEQFEFIRKYQRKTIPFEKHMVMLTHKNTVKNASELSGIGEGKCRRIYNHYAHYVLENREPKTLRLLGQENLCFQLQGKYYIFLPILIVLTGWPCHPPQNLMLNQF